MRSLGPTELIIILAIVIILFGVGRVSRIGSELGTAVREFRRGIQEDDTDTTDTEEGTSSTAES